MSKSLVIVESPNKVKTIKKFLGPDYIVDSSVGHIRDLPKSKGKSVKTAAEKAKTPKVKLTPEQKIFKTMGIDPKDWRGDYQVLIEKKTKVAELRKLAKQADKIYLATDLDREGEAIAWHLYEVLKDCARKEDFVRVTFNEITAKSIKEAFQNPSHINMDMVNAQQTRRFLDRIVGYMVSPLLWKKVARNLSAGRVQSVATKMLVEREREIAAYTPIDFWKITATSPNLPAQGNEKIVFDLDAIGSLDNKITAPEAANPNFVHSAQMMEEIMAALEGNPGKVVSIDSKQVTRSPNPPFTTATLQRTASTVLGFPIKKTMMTAQKLYEEGLITYMRTDAVNLSQDSIQMAREYLVDKFGSQYVPENPNYYSNKNSNAQEAHEAIRPTNPNNSIANSTLTSDQIRLYNLILERFLACQSTKAVFDSTTIHVEVQTNVQPVFFKTAASVMKFDGWRRIIKSGAKELYLDNINQGQVFNLDYDQQQTATKGPPRFNEASLVKELESKSIGRPSTYVSIISTIQDRGYARIEDKKFYATDIAQVVTNNLEHNFNNLLDYGFTAELEQQLDMISEGKENWKERLNIFLDDLRQRLDTAALDESQGGMVANKSIPTTFNCPKSNHRLSIRIGSTGVFLGCEGYKETDEKLKCSHTQSVTPFQEDDEDSEYPGLNCYLVDNHSKVYLDFNNHISHVVHGDYKIAGAPEVDQISCDICNETEGGVMTFKSGRFGPYMGCDKCKNTRKVLASGEISPPKIPATEYPEYPCKSKGSFFVLRRSAKGLFFGANNFPKCREQMPGFVKILQEFPERLPEDLLYFLSAPIQDPDGNPTILRMDMKEKKQYIGSLNDKNKPTKFRLDYDGKSWKAPSS